MLKALSYLVSGALVLSLSLNTLILSNYVLNYDYIVNELCVEKDVKDSCCKGSCHLNKEFEKKESSEQNSTTDWSSSFELETTVNQLDVLGKKDVFKELKTPPDLKENVSEGFPSGILHPPSAHC